jgi:hypothetical protein
MDQPGMLRFHRSYEDEVAISLSAIDCVLLGKRAAYASSELTSGRRAMGLLSDHALSSTSALRDRLGPDGYETALWRPNVQAAVVFAEELTRRVHGPVISPAPFTAPEWTQAAYLSFWETIIRTRISAVYFNDGWEYSHGCTFEFTVAAELGLPMFDRRGSELPVDQGSTLIEHAIREVELGGREATELRVSLARLGSTPS